MHVLAERGWGQTARERESRRGAMAFTRNLIPRLRTLASGGLLLIGALLAGPGAPGWAANPYLLLGPADELALDQPRVAIELVDPATGRSLGPSLANTFLLDTGANSILAVDDSVYELSRNGYVTEGTFFEQGVGGFTEFDVSAKYNINFAGSDGVINTIENGRLLSSETESFCPIPGMCSFFGIIGMPAMENRVTTLDLTTLLGDGGALDIEDLFSGDFSVGFLGTTFSNELPATNRRRYHVPIENLHFAAEGDGPLPSWSDLPAMQLTARHETQESSGRFILDTGAQLSIISSALAFELGLDANGNGSLDDEAIAFQEIGGVGGTINAPVMLFEELRLPSREGVDLIFQDIQVAVVDIDPTIDGIFGMNYLSTGWSGSLFGDLSDLAELLEEAGLADLLAELGGLGASGAGAPYAYFEKVHFDFKNWSKGQGEMVFDLMPEVSGVMAGDGTHGDFDADGDVDLDDRRHWVHDVKHTYFGDSNLDGTFDSKDLVAVFTAGEYEDAVLKNSTWQTGDWNLDCEFNTKDMVLAFQDGGYRANAAAQSVPEPATCGLLLVGATLLAARRRQISEGSLPSVGFLPGG